MLLAQLPMAGSGFDATGPVSSANASVIDQLSGWESCAVEQRRPAAPEEALEHRRLLTGEFWRRLPAYRNVDTETFLNHSWQARNSATNPARLLQAIDGLATTEFRTDLEDGYRRAPMAMRLSPYLLSLMNWDDPYRCPLRRQFLPLGGQYCEDHPQLELDSLHEQADSPVPGLTHRYSDKALFLPLNTCPVYCRFCTRSYAVGPDTDEVEKTGLRVDYSRWRRAFAYLASRPEIEDVVVSGGDSYNLRADQVEAIGLTLLGIPHIRRIRFATKGLAVMPQKVLSDSAWVDALTRVVEAGRKMHKEVAVHTHFNHPAEITWISQQAASRLHERGITVRNQSVLLRGVNDNVKTMALLVRRLSFVNVHPYYVYLCDMVKGVEDLRTSLAVAEQIEKGVRGVTAGFNTPTFVCDTPGGGGKRCVHSYEHYNRASGIAVYAAPSVKPGTFFLYCDPLHSLSEECRRRWHNPSQRRLMLDEALASASGRRAA